MCRHSGLELFPLVSPTVLFYKILEIKPFQLSGILTENFKGFLSILDNIETSGGKHKINMKKIQVKNDRMSLVFKKVIGKIQERNNNSLGHRFADLAKEFNEL